MEWQMAFELMIIYSPLYKLTDTGSTPVILSYLLLRPRSGRVARVGTLKGPFVLPATFKVCW